MPLQSLGADMRRRDFLSVLGGAAAAWPVVARGQQGETVRRIGIILPAASDNEEFQTRLAAFRQALEQLGWIIGRNVRIHTRWATANAAEIRRHVAELVASTPDVILAHASPGGNATGFMDFEYGLAAKWPELLKQIAPDMMRVAVLRDPGIPTGPAQFGIIQAVAPSLSVEAIAVNVRDAPEIERDLGVFARSSNGGLVVTSSSLSRLHRNLIVTLAARHKLPAVYWDRFFVAAGGLISYGSDTVDMYRRAAGYVDRILKGEKPADLPVQAPTKYETVINLKTAKALGLDISATVLARADEVIQ
jgi:putative ABC transport system substrate-binding protein